MTTRLEKLVQHLLSRAVCTDCSWNGPTPEFGFGDTALGIQASWRLRGPDATFGSGAQDVTGQPIDIVVGSHVEQVSVSGPFHDLRVTFDQGWTLETFSDSPNVENWQLAGVTGLIVVGPGVSWAQFPSVLGQNSGE